MGSWLGTKSRMDLQNSLWSKTKSLLEPAVHINRFEAEKYCKSINGRLPTFDEWKLAAYKQVLPSKVFQLNKIHKYPSGDKAEKMNSQGLLGYNRHMDVTKLPEGINGLVAMGGNVWEWIHDSKGGDSLTAGASWWYGASKTKESGAQYKPSDFMQFMLDLDAHLIIKKIMNKVKIYTMDYCPYCIRAKSLLERKK